MLATLDKKSNQNLAVANQPGRQQNPVMQLIDNRPQAIMQRRLFEMANPQFGLNTIPGEGVIQRLSDFDLSMWEYDLKHNAAFQVLFPTLWGYMSQDGFESIDPESNGYSDAQEAIQNMGTQLLANNDIDAVYDAISYYFPDEYLSKADVVKVKKYNFDGPISFTAENYVAWTRLATGQGTVDDLRYIHHEIFEIKQIEKGPEAEKIGSTDLGEEDTFWEHGYDPGHNAALTVEIRFLKEAVNRIYGKNYTDLNVICSDRERGEEFQVLLSAEDSVEEHQDAELGELLTALKAKKLGSGKVASLKAYETSNYQAPIQLKRAKQEVTKELSQHLVDDEDLDPTDIPFPQVFDTRSLAVSEKHYDDSYKSGIKIVAAIEKGKSEHETAQYIEQTDELLRGNYEDLLDYTVSVPAESSDSEQDVQEVDDDSDDLFGGLMDAPVKRAPLMEDVSIHPDTIQGGQEIKRYNIGTRRQKGSGETKYENKYDPKSKEFIAAQNFGDKDEEEATAYGGKVVSNADIIAAQIQNLRRSQLDRREEDRHKIEVKTLKRQGIINAQTLHTILWSKGSKMNYLLHNYSMDSTGVAKPGDEDFPALIGSPNGRAGGWLVVHYAKLLGLDPISSIDYDEDNMYIHYGEPQEFEDDSDDSGFM